MLVEADYKGHRIEVEAVGELGRWDATVRIRRTLTEDEPHVELITCGKGTAELAERWGAIWAKRWVDVNAG